MALIPVTFTLEHEVITGCGILAFLTMDNGKYVLSRSHGYYRSVDVIPFLSKMPFFVGFKVSSVKCKMVVG